MMSNLHGPNKLGYTGATMVTPKGSNNVNWSKTLKITLVQIVLCKREHEGGIASNRKTASYGEIVPRSSTHRPSRHGNQPIENGHFKRSKKRF